MDLVEIDVFVSSHLKEELAQAVGKRLLVISTIIIIICHLNLPPYLELLQLTLLVPVISVMHGIVMLD